MGDSDADLCLDVIRLQFQRPGEVGDRLPGVVHARRDHSQAVEDLGYGAVELGGFLEGAPGCGELSEFQVEAPETRVSEGVARVEVGALLEVDRGFVKSSQLRQDHRQTGNGVPVFRVDFHRAPELQQRVGQVAGNHVFVAEVVVVPEGADGNDGAVRRGDLRVQSLHLTAELLGSLHLAPAVLAPAQAHVKVPKGKTQLGGPGIELDRLLHYPGGLLEASQVPV